MGFLGLLTAGSAACDERCDIVGGLYEPYKAAVLSPETFDTWLADHPNHFTEARVACLVEKEQAAYQREIELLNQCDRHFSNDPEGLDFCRSSVESPEDFTTFWRAVLYAANGQASFMETGVGQQIYLLKLDDPTFYTQTWNEIFSEFGSAIEASMQCKKCTKPWYQFF
jgi:hypothetical protein